MSSISNRRQSLEEEISKQGKQLLSDSDRSLSQQRWEASTPYGETPNVLYDKHWGRQGVLYIDAFTNLPHNERFVRSFSVMIYHGEAGDIKGSESYFIYNPQKINSDNNYFYAAAWLAPGTVPGLDLRPLRKEEIDEVFEIFLSGIKDFGGKNIVARTIKSFSAVWDYKFVCDSLVQMRTAALQHSNSDWERYERQLDITSKWERCNSSEYIVFHDTV